MGFLILLLLQRNQTDNFEEPRSVAGRGKVFMFLMTPCPCKGIFFPFAVNSGIAPAPGTRGGVFLEEPKVLITFDVAPRNTMEHSLPGWPPCLDHATKQPVQKHFNICTTKLGVGCAGVLTLHDTPASTTPSIKLLVCLFVLGFNLNLTVG